MDTLSKSNVRKVDEYLISSLFDKKSSTLEDLEEHKSGMFSTQQKLLELKRNLLNFVNSYKNKNSIFYIFLDEETEQNLKIVVSSVLGESDSMTKRFAIILDTDLTDLKIGQLSLSSKMLVFVNPKDFQLHE
jgi:hypothetical protein